MRRRWNPSSIRAATWVAMASRAPRGVGSGQVRDLAGRGRRELLVRPAQEALEDVPGGEGEEGDEEQREAVARAGEAVGRGPPAAPTDHRQHPQLDRKSVV